MSWRHQLEAVLCAIFLFVSLLAVAVLCARGSASGQIKPGIQGVTRAVKHNTTSKAKDTPKGARPAAQNAFDSRTDLGSLWDNGPAYDLSSDEPDF